ncbi:MAG: hypothetical protein KAV87_20835 [Desulfobacteraceae bacterium]|nr:hypothetical protein [Desulfobacteraceae bacterium]
MPELSMDAKRDLIRGKLDPDNKHDIWIRDLYEKHVVIEDDGKLYEVTYTISDSNEVTLGDRKEVVVTYEALGELIDVEVLKAGTFTAMNGTEVTFSEEDLQEIADNATTLADTIKPPFVATHQEGENASLQAFASVHGGVLHNFRKVGEKLLADIKGVPKKAIALLKEVEEMRVSPEIYNNFKDDEGTAFGKVLRRLSWVDIPAIKSMAGITEANLFEEKPDQPTTWILLSEQKQSKPRKEEVVMPKDVSKLSEADIVALQEQADKVKGLEKTNADLKKENEGHVSKLSEVETKEKATAIGAIVAKFQDGEGKDVLAPAAMNSIKKFAAQLDSTTTIKLGEGDDAKEVTALAMFGDLLDNLIQRSDKGTLVVHLGEMAPTETDKDSVDETDADAIASAALEFQESEAKAGREISISSAVNHVTKKQ